MECCDEFSGVLSRLNNLSFLVCLQRRGGPAPWLSLYSSSSGPALTGLCAECSRPGFRTRGGVSWGQRGKGGSSLDPLATPLLMQPRMLLALQDRTYQPHIARSYLAFYPLGPPSSTGLLSVSFSPSLYSCLGLPWSRCSTLHLEFLIFVLFLWSHISILSRSCWIMNLGISQGYAFVQDCMIHWVKSMFIFKTQCSKSKFGETMKILLVSK